MLLFNNTQAKSSIGYALSYSSNQESYVLSLDKPLKQFFSSSYFVFVDTVCPLEHIHYDLKELLELFRFDYKSQIDSGNYTLKIHTYNPYRLHYNKVLNSFSILRKDCSTLISFPLTHECLDTYINNLGTPNAITKSCTP